MAILRWLDKYTRYLSINKFISCMPYNIIIILFLYIIQKYCKYFKVLYPLYNVILNISIYNYLDTKFINETLENRTTISLDIYNISESL